MAQVEDGREGKRKAFPIRGQSGQGTSRTIQFVRMVWQADHQTVAGRLTVVPNLGPSLHAHVLNWQTWARPTFNLANIVTRTRADYGARIDANGLAGS